jgi:alpha-1,2-mannosyltransferase
VWPASAVSTGPAWARRCWTNLVLGQINVVLMTLVLADCLPRRTRWPRGLLLGLAIALVAVGDVVGAAPRLTRVCSSGLLGVASDGVPTGVFAVVYSESLSSLGLSTRQGGRHGGPSRGGG